MLRRQRDRAGIAVAAGEAGALHEPRRRGLHAPIRLGEARRQRAVAEPLAHACLEPVELIGREDRVGEERAGRDRIGVAGIENHPLAPPQPQHRVANLAQRSRLAHRDAQLARELRVADRP